MGSFYTNITLVGVPVDDVVSRLTDAGTSAFVLASDGHVVVFDEAGDSQDGSHHTLARQLSADLGCVALAAMVHDSDILVVSAFTSGSPLGELAAPLGLAEEMVAEVAGMEGLDVDDAMPATTLDAATLASMFGVDEAAVAEVLAADATFAEDVHSELVDTLGLPGVAVGFGFRYLEQGELPGGPAPRRVPG